MLGHQVMSPVEDLTGWWIMQAAQDPVWEQLSYSLCKHTKWNEIVYTHQCLDTMMMSICIKYAKSEFNM